MIGPPVVCHIDDMASLKINFIHVINGLPWKLVRFNSLCQRTDYLKPYHIMTFTKGGAVRVLSDTFASDVIHSDFSRRPIFGIPLTYCVTGASTSKFPDTPRWLSQSCYRATYRNYTKWIRLPRAPFLFDVSYIVAQISVPTHRPIFRIRAP